MKTAGREAGKLCVVINKAEGDLVTVTGPKALTGVRRRKCNIAHLEPLQAKIKVKPDASDDEILELIKNETEVLEKFKLTVPSPEDLKKLEAQKTEKAAKKAELEKIAEKEKEKEKKEQEEKIRMEKKAEKPKAETEKEEKRKQETEHAKPEKEAGEEKKRPEEKAKEETRAEKPVTITDLAAEKNKIEKEKKPVSLSDLVAENRKLEAERKKKEPKPKEAKKK